MQIYGPSHVHGPQSINAPHFPNRTQGAESPAAGQPVDRVEISQAAEAAMKTTEAGGVRSDLVNLIRSQIASGTYDTPEKMDIALERMLDQIG